MSRVSLIDAVETAFRRQPWACIAGLLSAWTALFVTLWFAVLFAIVGAIAGIFALGILGIGFGQASQGASLIGGLGGAAAGFADAFAGIYGSSIANAPVHVLLSLVVGVVLAAVITKVLIAFESVLLDLRSYRRPSRRQQEAALEPMLKSVAKRMGIPRYPPIRIFDSPVPGAWTHTRTIVLSKGLVEQMDDEELSAVMAHELHHWIVGDALSMRFVWACGFPLILLINFYNYVVVWLQERPVLGSRVQRASIVAMLFVWPAFVLTRFLITPAMHARGRVQEYEADAAAIAAGYGPGLAAALTKLQDFEVARTGWEAALTRTHPPIEFRLEAIEESAAEPAPTLKAALAR